ncbi:hypothetical protein [Streptomyces winkii]|uniref:hypothetical protein n=1 Tax=Streptomyces winkii TaxID=3051178 RepID=UPI0028D758FD|nr:hypothetical protein [Streptomyces sp. DSM 40971]
MSESTKAALAASVAAGYLLGRRRKAKLAMAVAAFLVSKRLQVKPQELLAAGAGKLGDSPQLSQLAEQMRGEVLTVGREALRAAADRRLGSFADALADRTRSLNQILEAAQDEGEAEGRTDEERTDEERAAEAGEGGQRDRGAAEEDERDRPRTAERRARPRRPRRDAEGPQAAAKKTAKKAPPTKAAKKTAARKKPPAESSRRRR